MPPDPVATPDVALDATDPGPIVETEPALLDNPLPLDACSSGGFCVIYPAPIGVDLNAIWAFTRSDVWVFGNVGVALHFDGTKFSLVETGVRDNLVAVWASSPSNLFVLGANGSLLRYDGQRFQSLWRTELEPYEKGHAQATPDGIDLVKLPPLAKHAAAHGRFSEEMPRAGHGPAVYRDLVGTPDGRLWVAGGIETSPANTWVPASYAGLLRIFDGKSWSVQTSEGEGIWGSLVARGTSEVFAWSELKRATRFASDGSSLLDTPLTPRHFRALHARGMSDDLVLVWQLAPQDSWVVRHKNAGELVERVNHVSGEPRPKSSNAAVALPKGTVRDLRGTSPDDVWLVGKNGLLLHFDGKRWRGLVPEYPVESPALRAVCAVTPTDVWAVGERGTVLRHNGTLARVTAGPATTGALYGVWGKRSDSVWVAGEAGAFHFDGTAWTRLELPKDIKPTWVSGTGEEVWMGDLSHGRVFRGNAERLLEVELPPVVGDVRLLPRAPGDPLLVGRSRSGKNGWQDALIYSADSRGLARTAPELEALMNQERLYDVYSWPDDKDVSFGSSATRLVRIRNGSVTDSVAVSDLHLGRWAGPNGSFFALTSKGVVSYEGNAFRYDAWHVEDPTWAITGNEHDVWAVTYGGALLRRRLGAQ